MRIWARIWFNCALRMLTVTSLHCVRVCVCVCLRTEGEVTVLSISSDSVALQVDGSTPHV